MIYSRFARILGKALLFGLMAASLPACGGNKSGDQKAVVIFSSPSPGAGNVPRQPLIYVRFNQAMDAATMAGNVLLLDQASAQIPINVSYYAPLNEIRIIPVGAIGTSATTPSYQVTLLSGLKSLSGNAFDGYFFQFTTLATTDADRPSFAGASSVTLATTTTLTINWLAVASDTTTPGGISYDVFMATSTGMEDLTSYFSTSTTGGLSLVVTGLTTGKMYHFIVKARDSFGNMDTNVVEVSGSTL